MVNDRSLAVARPVFGSRDHKPCCTVYVECHQPFTTASGTLLHHRSTDPDGKTNIPGVFVAGDVSRDVQLAIIAAAEGARAGLAINRYLIEKATHSGELG